MPLFGKLIDLKRWDVAFLMAAVLPVVGHVCWLWVNQREMVET
jgi:hypothetical protein